MQNQDFIAGLKAKFAEHRIVFWHDPDKRFIEELEQLKLENVTLINMTHASQLAVKKRIEETGSFIIANTPEQFAQQIKDELAVYKQVVAKQKLKLE